MRLIINTKLLETIQFKVLDKDQIVALLKISSHIFSTNSSKIKTEKKLLLALTGLDELRFNELIEYGFFSINENVVQWNNESINYFKNNNENVKRHNEKKKATISIKVQPLEIEQVEEIEPNFEDTIEEVKEVVKKKSSKKEDNIDWNRIMNMFNNTFKDFEHVSKVQGLPDKRKKAVNTIYEYAKKQVDPIDGSKYEFDDIYDFCEQYFELCSKRNGIRKSWINKGGNNYFKFTWEHFFFNLEKYINITENGKYN